jgi:hypothetical protein
VIVLDTGGLYAALDANEALHDPCVAILATSKLDYLIGQRVRTMPLPGGTSRRESIPDVIKQHFRGGSAGRDLLEALRRTGLSDETLEAADAQVRARVRAW